MKVQLIQPSTGEYRSNSRSGCYPPLGLVSMATYVRETCPSVDLEILDGEVMSDDDIINRLDADLIGVNTNTVTYPQAVRIANAAKLKGCRVVFGGVYASAIPHVILRNRANVVDSIVVGYGERPLVELIRGRCDRLVVNDQPYLEAVRYPDRKLVRLDTYVEIFRKRHPTWGMRGTNVFTSVGCWWREQRAGGCIFCSRSGSKVATREPSSVWDEIRELVDAYGIEYVVDFSDTILHDIEWLKLLIHRRPADVGPLWHVFARIDEITPSTLALVKRLPCDHIFVGIESGNSQIYREARKGGGSPAASLAMARLLKELGVKMTPSFVIGLPGESTKSLRQTYELARRIRDITQFEEVFCSQLIPFPGSPAFDRLCKIWPMDTDLLDVDELKYLWATHFCKVPCELMQEHVSMILSLGKYPITISKREYPAVELESNACTSESHSIVNDDKYTCV